MITCKTISKLARDFNCEDFSQRKTTKKGDRRKTVSKRRAYVNTTSEIRKKLAQIQKVIQGNPLERRWRQDGVSPADTQEALKLLRQLSSRFLYGK